MQKLTQASLTLRLTLPSHPKNGGEGVDIVEIGQVVTADSGETPIRSSRPVIPSREKLAKST